MTQTPLLRIHRIMFPRIMILCSMILWISVSARAETAAFFQQHCYECHDAQTKEAGLDLSALKTELASPDNFARWVKVFDRIESGEMPPKDQPRPKADELATVLQSLKGSLIAAERARLAGEGRTGVRRLTRAEYENTVRDLFDMPGIALQGNLPADGSAHGFDKNSDALDISHVNLAKYVEAADLALDLAIATRPEPPQRAKAADLAGQCRRVRGPHSGQRRRGPAQGQKARPELSARRRISASRPRGAPPDGRLRQQRQRSACSATRTNRSARILPST